MPLFRKVLSSLVYHEEATNDHLEAYPERLHVEALPERRYLKTTRFWVVLTLISLAFNFAMCFIYMRNASLVETLVDVPQRQDTFLYNLDHFNKELRPVEKPVRALFMEDLIYQNLIADYLTERFQVTGNMSEMQQRWGDHGKVYAYAPKAFDAFQQEKAEGLARLSKGLTQEIYIYSIREVGNKFYEAVFDVFMLDELGYNKQKCPCFDKTKECLTCLRETATNVQRKKAYMRVKLDIPETPLEEIYTTINPYFFLIEDLYILQHGIHLDNVWEDADLILE